jgi:6-phosphofructokinase 2
VQSDLFIFKIHIQALHLPPQLRFYMKIITLTVNPALDKSTTSPAIVPEKKLRCAPVSIDAGGGGINVSKGLHRLGASSVAVFPIGGNNGKMLQNLVKTEGIRTKCLEIAGETRESFSVSDEHTGLQYRFTMPGVSITDTDAQNLLDLTEQLKPDILVASGSLPAGLNDNYYQQVAQLAHRIGAKFILDCSGAPLLQAAQEGVYLLKPNLGELSNLSGVPELEMNQVDDAARDLISKGKVEVVVVSLGGQGAVLVTKDKLEHIPVPPVKVRTTVGAGDSMVSGMVWALSKRKNLSDMVRMGVSCGTAATLQAGTKLFQQEEAMKVYDWIKTNKKRFQFTAF